MIPAMERSPLLDRHLSAGARLAERPEAPGTATPLLFGDVPGEYAAAREGCALFDVSDRGRLTIRGPDAADFLHRLLANHVKSLAPGRGNRNLLLSSKGKVRHLFDLVRREDGFELSTAPGEERALGSVLETFHFGEQLTLEPSGARHAPLELSGPGSLAVVERVLGDRIRLEPRESLRLPWQAGELDITALAVGGSSGLRLDGGPELAGPLWEALVAAGARPSGLAVRDILRVEAGCALPGVDIDENVYPQEARLEDALALDKGCYVGQEVVAKIDTYGGLNKRLELLRIAHGEPVPRGTALLRLDERGERRELGLVTSWTYSFAHDTGLVLGYVKRKHQEPGTEFELGGGHGRATLLPFPTVSGAAAS